VLLGVPVASTGDEVDKLVGRRLSPGVVALFAGYARDPRIAARLKTALVDNAAPVRSVAARVVALGGIGGLLSAVKDALEKEMDADAGREEIRALCVVGGAAADAEALVGAKRFSPRLDGAYARIVAGLRGAEALPLYFSTLRQMALSPSQRRTFFRRIVDHDGKDVLTAAGSLALSRQDRKDWEAVLVVAAEREAPLEEGVLLAALRGDEDVLRGEAAWYMAKAYQNRPTQKKDEILKAVSDVTVPSSDAELRFGVEMLGRVFGKEAVEDEGWIACLDTNPQCHLDSDFVESPLVELLTERERVALLRRNKAHRPPDPRSRPKDAGRKAASAARRPPDAESERDKLRLVAGLPAGTAADLLAAGGCRSTSHHRWYSVANIEFGLDELPRHVTLYAPPSSPECQRTAEAIFLMSTAPDDANPRHGENPYLALFDADCLICNEESAAPPGTTTASTETVRVRGTVVAPKLENKVEPFYPEEARKQRQEGVDIYEAIISPTGCVREIRLLRGSHPLLDMVGMEAIARWRYKPALLDGKPVAVYLTVTVTYSLHAKS